MKNMFRSSTNYESFEIIIDSLESSSQSSNNDVKQFKETKKRNKNIKNSSPNSPISKNEKNTYEEKKFIYEENYPFSEFIFHEDLLLYKNKEEQKIFDQLCKCCHKYNSSILLTCNCTFCKECGNTILDINDNCPQCNVTIDKTKVKHNIQYN
jgi:hypothetical protein